MRRLTRTDHCGKPTSQRYAKGGKAIKDTKKDKLVMQGEKPNYCIVLETKVITYVHKKAKSYVRSSLQLV